MVKQVVDRISRRRIEIKAGGRTYYTQSKNIRSPSCFLHFGNKTKDEIFLFYKGYNFSVFSALYGLH